MFLPLHNADDAGFIPMKMHVTEGFSPLEFRLGMDNFSHLSHLFHGLLHQRERERSTAQNATLKLAVTQLWRWRRGGGGSSL